MDSLKLQLLQFLHHERTLEVATYITFLAIIAIRIRLGHFTTRTKWFGFFGLLGLFQLWLAQAQQPTSAADKCSRAVLTGHRQLCIQAVRHGHRHLRVPRSDGQVQIRSKLLHPYIWDRLERRDFRRVCF
jgi:hypothetical protein